MEGLSDQGSWRSASSAWPPVRPARSCQLSKADARCTWAARCPGNQPVQQNPDQSLMRPGCPATLAKFWMYVHVSELCSMHSACCNPNLHGACPYCRLVRATPGALWQPVSNLVCTLHATPSFHVQPMLQAHHDDPLSSVHCTLTTDSRWCCVQADHPSWLQTICRACGPALQDARGSFWVRPPHFGAASAGQPLSLH